MFAKGDYLSPTGIATDVKDLSYAFLEEQGGDKRERGAHTTKGQAFCGKAQWGYWAQGSRRGAG